MSKNFALYVVIVLTALFTSGCVVGIGDGKGSPTPTVGQELIDLQKARDAGAITGEEYSAGKQRLLAR